MTWSAWIFSERKRLGLTQAQLANLLDVDTQSVSNWECGRNEPWAKTQERIAARLAREIGPERTRVIDRILRDI